MKVRILDTELFELICLRIANILEAIGDPDGNTITTYPKKPVGEGRLLAFPMDIEQSVPFWFVLPVNFSNIKVSSQVESDGGPVTFRLSLYIAKSEFGWPGEKTGDAIRMMSWVLAKWSQYVTDKLAYSDGTHTFVKMFNVHQVSGISWPSGVSGLSASPFSWADEEYVGLGGEVTISVSNIKEV